MWKLCVSIARFFAVIYQNVSLDDSSPGNLIPIRDIQVSSLILLIEDILPFESVILYRKSRASHYSHIWGSNGCPRKEIWYSPRIFQESCRSYLHPRHGSTGSCSTDRGVGEGRLWAVARLRNSLATGSFAVIWHLNASFPPSSFLFLSSSMLIVMLLSIYIYSSYLLATLLLEAEVCC